MRKIFIANGIEPLKKSSFCRGLIVVIVEKETLFGKINVFAESIRECGIKKRNVVVI